MKIAHLLLGSALVVIASLASLGCSDDEAADSCQEGEFQCVGEELQRCDAAGTFQTEEMCGDGTTCSVSMGHCHPDGGHNGGGGTHAGGHSAGGMHMGGAGGAGGN